MGSAELLPGSQCQAPLAARLLAVHPGAAQHEAANKEAQSTNEEMANRNTELNSISNDLANLQSSTQIAIVLLGVTWRFAASPPRQKRSSACSPPILADLSATFGTN